MCTRRKPKSANLSKGRKRAAKNSDICHTHLINMTFYLVALNKFRCMKLFTSDAIFLSLPVLFIVK